jgi:hypothetical protein
MELLGKGADLFTHFLHRNNIMRRLGGKGREIILPSGVRPDREAS